MPTFNCPRCGAMNTAASADGLVCYACGHGGAAEGPKATVAPVQASPAAWLPPGSPAPPTVGAGCPHCRSPLPPREKIATWALVLGIVLTILTFCPLFLLFFLAKERNCPVCAYRYA